MRYFNTICIAIYSLSSSMSSSYRPTASSHSSYESVKAMGFPTIIVGKTFFKLWDIWDLNNLRPVNSIFSILIKRLKFYNGMINFSFIHNGGVGLILASSTIIPSIFSSPSSSLSSIPLILPSLAVLTSSSGPFLSLEAEESSSIIRIAKGPSYNYTLIFGDVLHLFLEYI